MARNDVRWDGLWEFLHRAAGGGARGPGPLEVESAEVAGDVDDFADEVEAGHAAALHGLCGKRAGADAACGNFGFVVALGAAGREGEGVQPAFQFIKCVIRPAFGRGDFAEPVGQTRGQMRTEGGLERSPVAACVGFAQRREERVAGRPIDADRFRFVPIRRDLQDGRAAEAAMREEHLLAEGAFAASNRYCCGDAGEIGEAVVLCTGKSERDKRRSARLNGNLKLAGDVVAESCCAHFGYRQATGGDDERGCGEDLIAGDNGEGSRRIVAADGGDGCVWKHVNTGFGTFAHQEVDDLLRGAIAEELTQSFFVISDAVALDEAEEVGRRVAREGRFCEVRICGEEIVGPCMQVREVATASAGDEDLFARAFGALENGDATTAAAGLERGDEAGRACTENEDIEVVGFHGVDLLIRAFASSHAAKSGLASKLPRK